MAKKRTFAKMNTFGRFHVIYRCFNFPKLFVDVKVLQNCQIWMTIPFDYSIPIFVVIFFLWNNRIIYITSSGKRFWAFFTANILYNSNQVLQKVKFLGLPFSKNTTKLNHTRYLKYGNGNKNQSTTMHRYTYIWSSLRIYDHGCKFQIIC